MKALLTGMIAFCCGTTLAQTKQTVIVYFEFDKYVLTNNARAQLDSFINKQKQAPDDIKLSGYCDETGTEHYNDQLSSRRVKTVKKYLLANQVDPANIAAAVGYGEKKPVNDNKTGEERQLNRRVEISIASSAGKSS